VLFRSHDVALQKLPVIFCLDRAGLVGEDGATHHGVFDLAYLSCIPNMIIMAPRNEMELRNIMYTAQLGLNGPIAIRYPRGRGFTTDWKCNFSKTTIGSGIQLKDGNKLAILSLGTTAYEVDKAIMKCNSPEAIAHFDMRFMKPLDQHLLHDIFKKYQYIITVEDGCLTGGFGSLIKNFALDNKYKVNIISMGVPDKFIEHGKVEELKAIVAINPESIAEMINKLLNHQHLT